MDKLPGLVNETAVRNERIFAYWQSLCDHTDYSYDEKIKLLSDEFFIGRKTAAKIIELKSKARIS